MGTVKSVFIFTSFLIVCLAVVITLFEEETVPEMSIPANVRESFKAANRSVFVLGYTGETGKEVVKHLLSQNIFSRIVLLGRREVPLDVPEGVSLEQKIVDYEKLEEHADAFKDIDTGICCLGTTRSKAGKEMFLRVDCDYTLKSAEVAKANGCQHFSLVSSAGANKNAWFLYPQTKGRIEEAIGQLGFQRYSIYRPAVLMCDREESRPHEAAFRFLLKPFAKLCPTVFTTPTPLLARAILNNIVAEGQPRELIDNKRIFALAKGTEGEKEK